MGKFKELHKAYSRISYARVLEDTARSLTVQPIGYGIMLRQSGEVREEAAEALENAGFHRLMIWQMKKAIERWKVGGNVARADLLKEELSIGIKAIHEKDKIREPLFYTYLFTFPQKIS
jgi:hypothetical protein